MPAIGTGAAIPFNDGAGDAPLAQLPLVSSIAAGIGNFESFTRATAATVTDFEGIIRPVGSSEVRFDRARRVENLVPTYDIRDWNNKSGSFTIEAGIADPFGGNDAFRITTSGTSLIAIKHILTNTTRRKFKDSCWVKWISGTSFLNGFFIETSDGVNSNSTIQPGVIETYTDWTRVSAESGDNAGVNAQLGFSLFHSGTCVFDIYGFQLEDITGQLNEAPGDLVTVKAGTESENLDLAQANWDVTDPRWSHDGTKLSLSIGAGDASLHYTSYAASQFVSTDNRIYELFIDIENFTETGTLAKSIELWTGFNSNETFSVEGRTGSFTLRTTVRADNTGRGVSDSIYIGAQTASPGDNMSFDVVNVSMREIAHGANVDGVKYFNTFNRNYETVIAGTSDANLVSAAPSGLQMLANPEFDTNQSGSFGDDTLWEWTGSGTMEISGGVAKQIGNFGTGRDFYQDTLNKNTWIAQVPRSNIKGLVFKFEYKIKSGVLDVTDPNAIRVLGNIGEDINGEVFSTTVGVDHVYYVATDLITSIGNAAVFELTRAGVDPNLEIEYVRLSVAGTLPELKGVWSESARTNLHNNSENSAVTWQPLGSAQETGQNRVTPVGIKANPRWILAVTNSIHGVFGTTAATGGVTVTNLANVVISGMIKSDQRYIGIANGLVIPQTKATFDTQTKQFLNLGSAVVQASYVDLNDGWWHIFVHYANVANTNAFPYMLCSNINDVSTSWLPAGTEFIEAQGVQVENSVVNPSTYIKSDAGSATTRNQELLNYDLGAIAAPEDYENIVASMYMYWDNRGAASGTYSVSASDRRDANNYDLVGGRSSGSDSDPTYAINHGGLPQAALRGTPFAQYAFTRNSIDTNFDRTPVSRRFLAHSDGVEYSNLDPVNRILAAAARTLNVGHFNGTLNSFGPVKDVLVYNTARSEGQLISESTP